MLEENFLQFVINDILSTKEYSLEGIAQYADISEEVIYDILTGSHKIPSLPLSRKIIELHKSVRQDLYSQIFKKITLGNVA